MRSPEFTARVVEAVKARMLVAWGGTLPEWYSGVCLDLLDTWRGDEDDEDDFGDLVEDIYFDTLYWDAPNSGF